MSKWTKAKVGEVSLGIYDGPHATPAPCETPGPYFLGIPQISRLGFIDMASPRYIAERDYGAWTKRVVPQYGDVVFSYEATLNLYALIPRDFKCCLGRRMGLVRPNPKKLDFQFLYYYFFSPEWRGTVRENTITGATVDRLSIAAFPNFEIALPPLPIQRRIAAILSDYDSAIENARRQIALLEEAAMRLYREWFVVHANPKWEKRRIGDVIEFNPKVQIPKETVHEIVPMSALQVNSMILDSATIEYGISKSGSKFTNGDTLLARITPCLENGKTAFVGNLKSSCGASGSTEFIVMRSKKLNPYMVYLIARTPDFREAAIKSMSGADGRQRAKEDILKNIPYRLPSEGLIKKFGDVAEPMFNRAYLLQSQIESLTEARDRLLPKLMSGEIEV